MKKKKRISLAVKIIAILVLVIPFVVSMIGGIFCVSEGIYVMSEGDSAIIACEGDAIIMSNSTSFDIFDNLEMGDKVLVLHGAIELSYPSRSSAFAVFKLGDGDTSEIPQSAIGDMIFAGWIESAEDIGLDSSSEESSEN